MVFEKVTPESVGIPSSAVMGLINQMKHDGVEMHSMMLLRHGKVYAQGWWAPYAPDLRHIMFSFSKSYTSTAVGFMEQEGMLSLEERLVDIFPEFIPENPSENLLKCNVSHLLMMGCGHENEIETTFTGSGNWIKDFMNHPFVYEPGTKFMYNTAGTNMLSAIIKKKTGQTLTEYLEPRLFRPLGMSENIKCFTLPDGTEAGGFGFKLCTEDMARFVQFILQKGQWEGKQILSADWFERATSKQIRNDDSGNPNPDWAAGYGYQFWRCGPEGVFRGDGAFGQFGIVIPHKDMAIAITSTSIDLQLPLNAVYSNLLSNVSDEPLPENPGDYARLCFMLENLSLPVMLDTRAPECEKKYTGKSYIPTERMHAFTNYIGGAGKFVWENTTTEKLSFNFEYDDEYLEVTESDRSYRIPLGVNGKFESFKIGDETFAANGAWRARDKFEMQIRNLHCTTGKRFIFELAEDKLTITADNTVPENGGLTDGHIPNTVLKAE